MAILALAFHCPQPWQTVFGPALAQVSSWSSRSHSATSPIGRVRRPHYTAGLQATHGPPSAGWRTTPQWSRNRDGSPSAGPRQDPSCAFRTWTQPTQATTNALPPTHSRSSQLPVSSTSNLVSLSTLFIPSDLSRPGGGKYIVIPVPVPYRYE